MASTFTLNKIQSHQMNHYHFKSIDGTQVKLFPSGKVTIVRFNKSETSNDFIAEMCHIDPTKSIENWLSNLEPSDEESFNKKLYEYITHIRLLGVQFDRAHHSKT